jgi:PadR family transcriptional regulator, regulatory protein AphA
MQTTPVKTKLSATEAAVLGLLTRGERSGYDLNKAVQRGVGYIWAPAKSQIYAVLPRLVGGGYATRRSKAQEQRPDKQLYRITGEGRRAFTEWLEEPESGTSGDRFLLKVFFGAHMSREALVSLVEEARRQSEAKVAQYQRIEEEIRDREQDFYGYLTLRYGLASQRAFIRWANETLRTLAAREGSE